MIVYSNDAKADRNFFNDIFGFGSVDAGGGWLIFRLPPAEVAFHPADEYRNELFLMCDDLGATIAALHRKGVVPVGDIEERSWGRMAHISLPGGGCWESISRSTLFRRRRRLQKSDRATKNV